MFRTAARVVRPALAHRRLLKQQSFRTFSTTLRASSGAPPPVILGTGGKPGEVPSDVEQATGLERLQLLGEIEGVDVFDERPLDSSRIGTKANPVLVQSYDVERMVGCTGSPADSHDVAWFVLKKERQGRCTECGSVYQLDYQGEEHHDHAHH